MTADRALNLIPMRVKRGGNDLVNHVLRHYVCASRPFDFGARPPFDCPERAALRAAIEAAHPAAPAMLAKLQAATDQDAASFRKGAKSTRAKGAILGEDRWWTCPEIHLAVRAAHDQGYALRYRAFVRSHPLPGEPGAAWVRVPKHYSNMRSRHARAAKRETKRTPLKRFERHPGTLRLDIYVLVGEWDGYEGRLKVKTAHVAEGALSKNPAYASNEAERKQVAADAQKKLQKIGGKLSARGGRRRLSERERRKLLQLR